MAENSHSSSAFNLGRGAHIDKLTVGGNVAGRDVVVGVTPADASAAADLHAVMEMLLKLQQQVAALEDAPAGLREDAADELRKAHEAGAQNDPERLAEKLHSAQSYLERIGAALPPAVAIAQTVASLALRVTGLG
jgi:hypothetical protein